MSEVESRQGQDEKDLVMSMPSMTMRPEEASRSRKRAAVMVDLPLGKGVSRFLSFQAMRGALTFLSGLRFRSADLP